MSSLLHRAIVFDDYPIESWMWYKHPEISERAHRRRRVGRPFVEALPPPRGESGSPISPLASIPSPPTPPGIPLFLSPIFWGKEIQPHPSLIYPIRTRPFPQS